MKTEISNELNQAIKEIANRLRPALHVIHETKPTTKNYYGDYMAILSGTNDKGKIKLVALAMIEAGANVYGVESAVKLLTGE